MISICNAVSSTRLPTNSYFRLKKYVAHFKIHQLIMVEVVAYIGVVVFYQS